jgi:hypothetical protein
MDDEQASTENRQKLLLLGMKHPSLDSSILEFPGFGHSPFGFPLSQLGF